MLYHLMDCCGDNNNTIHMVNVYIDVFCKHMAHGQHTLSCLVVELDKIDIPERGKFRA